MPRYLYTFRMIPIYLLRNTYISIDGTLYPSRGTPIYLMNICYAPPHKKLRDLYAVLSCGLVDREQLEPQR